MISKTILVIDDVTTERVFLRKLLQPMGYQVLEASDGKSGIDLAHRHTPDLILMDVVMPDRSGFQVTRDFKKIPALAGIPIVMVTTKSRTPDKENASENGAVGYVVKPATASSLKAVLDRVLP